MNFARKPLFLNVQELPLWDDDFVGCKFYVRSTKEWYTCTPNGWESSVSPTNASQKVPSVMKDCVVSSSQMTVDENNGKYSVNIVPHVYDGDFSAWIKHMFTSELTDVNSNPGKIDFHVVGPEAYVSHLISKWELFQLSDVVRHLICRFHRNWARPIGYLYSGVDQTRNVTTNRCIVDFTIASGYKLFSLPNIGLGTRHRPGMSGDYGIMFTGDASTTATFGFNSDTIFIRNSPPNGLHPWNSYTQPNSTFPFFEWVHGFSSGIWFKAFTDDMMNPTWITCNFVNGLGAPGVQGLGNDSIAIFFDGNLNRHTHPGTSTFDRLYLYKYATEVLTFSDAFSFNLDIGRGGGLMQDNYTGYHMGSDKPDPGPGGVWPNNNVTQFKVQFNGDQLVSVTNTPIVVGDFSGCHTMSTETHGIVIGGEDSIFGITSWVRSFDFATLTTQTHNYLYTAKAFGQMSTGA